MLLIAMPDEYLIDDEERSRNAERYREIMRDIKMRCLVIGKCLNGSINLEYERSFVEFVALQYRMIVESIVYSWLVAYQPDLPVPMEKIRLAWRLKTIVEWVSSKNPNYYPVPGRQVLDPQTGKVLSVEPIVDGVLKLDDIYQIYDECSDIAHAPNPFSDARHAFEETCKKYDIWLQKVIATLNHHSIQLAPDGIEWWVLMRCRDTGDVALSVMEKQKQPKD